MAERLTDKYHDAIKDCEEYSSCYSCEREICYITEVCEKLGKLEDILEKYGIESVEELSNALEYAKVIGEILCEYGINDNENLEWFLDDYSKNQGRDFAICRDTLRQEEERDTWKRACELASETLKQVMGKPLWIGGNIPAPEVKDTEYFYQQAKKEGNDESNND